jgi:hypothetical protein
LTRALFGALDGVGEAQLKSGVIAAIPGGVESELVERGWMKRRWSRQCRVGVAGHYHDCAVSRGIEQIRVGDVEPRVVVANWVSK